MLLQEIPTTPHQLLYWTLFFRNSSVLEIIVHLFIRSHYSAVCASTKWRKNLTTYLYSVYLISYEKTIATNLSEYFKTFNSLVLLLFFTNRR
jgi:hypothetical protein